MWLIGYSGWLLWCCYVVDRVLRVITMVLLCSCYAVARVHLFLFCFCTKKMYCRFITLMLNNWSHHNDVNRFFSRQVQALKKIMRGYYSCVLCCKIKGESILTCSPQTLFQAFDQNAIKEQQH